MASTILRTNIPNDVRSSGWLQSNPQTSTPGVENVAILSRSHDPSSRMTSEDVDSEDADSWQSLFKPLAISPLRYDNVLGL
jgi:hypothetical protein